MYTQLHTGEIIFYYAQSGVFDDVQHQSAFMCKNIVTKEGDDLSERFAITEDEAPMFSLCLREILPIIYEAVRPLTHGITDALNDDMLGSALKDIEGLSALDVDDDAKYIVIRLQDNAAYNPNELKIADSTIRSSIEQGVLSEFYSRVVHKELTEMSGALFNTQVSALTRRIVGLRKKTSL